MKRRIPLLLFVILTGIYFGTKMMFQIEPSEEVLSNTVKFLASNTFGDRELPIYSVETDEKRIALSFDAAWGVEDFNDILAILKEHNIKVTFFMTGGWVEANPECVKRLVEEGHELGNHSEHHYDMTTLSEEQKREEIQLTHDKVYDLTGYKMCVFRPPSGAYDNELICVANDMGYETVQWNVDSLDWKDYGVESIIDTVCNHKELGNGSIILCHNGAKYIADALDTMLTNLENQGYTIGTISDLILTEDYHMDVTGRQIPDKKNDMKNQASEIETETERKKKE